MGHRIATLALGLKYGPEGWDLNLVAGFGLGFAYPRLGFESQGVVGGKNA